MKFISAIIIILLVSYVHPSYAHSVNQLNLPKGWVLPDKSIRDEDWRNESKLKYTEAIGDFNGDGLIDHAYLLLSKDKRKFGFFVFLATRIGTYNVYKLYEVNEFDKLEVFGMEKLEPGMTISWCRKITCGENDKDYETKLKNDSILIFKLESAEMVYFWNSFYNKFIGSVISD